MAFSKKDIIIHTELETLFSTITSPEFTFLYGYEKEVNQILNNMNRSLAKKDDTELVCWLVQNYKKDYFGDAENQYDFTVPLNLVLICKSNAKDYTQQRYEKNIIPKLIPLQNAIIDTLKNSGIVDPYFNFSTTEIPFYEAANRDSNVFDSFVDVILLEINLKFTKQFNC